jgi:hypothetical protein
VKVGVERNDDEAALPGELDDVGIVRSSVANVPT